MRGNRFLIIIAHPVHGRLLRMRVPPWTPHALAAAAFCFVILLTGLVADLSRQQSLNERLVTEHDGIQSEYDSLQTTLDERDRQLESLTRLAYQVSIAYGLRRGDLEIEDVYGSEPRPAYYASLSQYDLLHYALNESRPGNPAGAALANTTPAIWPVKGHITSSYGMRSDPFDGTGSFHPGIDVSAPYGTPVVATADGYVLSAEWEGALGHGVKIRHGQSGFATVYGHLKEYFVRPGQFVRRGEVIGQVGRSGRTTGKHLHYEVHYNRMTVNPYRYLRDRERTYETSLAD